MQNNDVMCKNFLTTFHEFSHVWYHSFEPSIILSLYNIFIKLISHLSTNIKTKKSTIELLKRAKIFLHVSKVSNEKSS
jgi:hypothetical protein